jgi:integrase
VSRKSKVGVRAKLKENSKDKEEGTAAASQNPTVEKYLDQWLKSTRDTVKPGSFKPYEFIVRLHRKSTLGKTRLEKLNALQLQRLYKEKLTDGLGPRHV